MMTNNPSLDLTEARLSKLARIHQTLKDNGSRITSQREYILELFLDESLATEHLSAEEIHTLLKERYDLHISLATVYRTVKTLSELGILREVDLAEGHKHYELLTPEQPHHHIICLNCDHKTIDFQDAEVDELARKIAAKHKIKVRDVELKITGTCVDSDAE